MAAAAVYFNEGVVTVIGTSYITDDDSQVVKVRIMMILIRNDSVAVYIYLRTGGTATYRGTVQLNHRCDWIKGRGEEIKS